MKTIVYILTASILLFSCKKSELTNPENQYVSQIRSLLKDSLSTADYAAVDFASIRTSALSQGGKVTRLGFTGKKILHDFIVIREDKTGAITQAGIVHLEGSISSPNTGARPSFNGRIEASTLKREIKASSVINNGFVMSLHAAKVGTNAVGVNMAACPDCTIPEVIVSSSYSGSGISWGAWMSFLAMFGGGGWGNEYMMIDYGGGGGGGGNTSGDVVTIDMEAPENKPAIDPKKYMDCFGNIPDNGATCTITIASDIPVDGQPDKFFNWSDASPGHTYIELYKAGSSGGIVSQNIGFYPNSSWKVVAGTNISSKIGDDAGHEYNARYTISVSPAQLQAAINAVNTYSSHEYNISTFNCADFSLAVFNAAGGNLTIPKYQIPGYPNGSTGSNTPQGLYNKISDLAFAGNPNAQTNGNKAYGGLSNGPCN